MHSSTGGGSRRVSEVNEPAVAALRTHREATATGAASFADSVSPEECWKELRDDHQTLWR